MGTVMTTGNAWQSSGGGGRGLAAARVIVVGALGLALCVAAQAPASAITYGTPVVSPVRSAPWAVSLWWAPSAAVSPEFVCSATAIGPREVVTAAHCLAPTGFTYVDVGATTLGKGRRVAVEAGSRDPSYRDSRYTGDVAVLRPLHDLELSTYARVGTSALSAAVRSSTPPPLGLFGWGDDERGRISGHLVSVTVRPQSREAVRDYGAAFAPSRMLAAGRWNTKPRAWSGACNGDSGGPLIVRSGVAVLLVGVTAFGGENCATDGPTVFTDVSRYAVSIRRSRLLLPRLARTDNRALPESVRSPRVSGARTPGSVLSCSQGAWSSNARVYSWRWYRGATSLGGGQRYVVRDTDPGTTVRCVVTAGSHAGGRAISVPVALPA